MTLRISPTLRLQWEEVHQCHVLLYPEGMVKLNPSAAAVLQLCDGQRDEAAIIATLQQQFPDADLADDVRALLEHAHAQGWIQHD